MSDEVQCIAQCDFVDKSRGVHYSKDQIFALRDKQKAQRWAQEGLIHVLSGEVPPDTWPWGVPEGRHLSCLSEEPHDYNRIVIGLNIWQDLPDLKQTIDTWYPYVDHVIAVDGAYAKVPAKQPYSTDGTIDFLKSKDKVELVETDEFWDNQREKRSVYFDRAERGDLLFVVDADEHVYNIEALEDAPYMDVGWVRYDNPIYRRLQDFPRLFHINRDLRYKGRHHWIFDQDDHLITTAQRGGREVEHRSLPIMLRNHRGINRHPEREALAQQHRIRQAEEESKVGPQQTGGREPLRIVQLCSIDPGMVSCRLHTAINSTTPHESIMASSRHDRPYDEPYQYCVKEDRSLLQRAISSADLVWCHLSYQQYYQLGLNDDIPVVIHHHGTMYRENAEKSNDTDRRRSDVRLVSNLELLSYGRNLYYLPNPVPVAQYKRLGDALRPAWEDSPFRVAHSPSKREKKGTEAFLATCEELNEEGLDVEPVLIENDTIETSIRKKAESHACFDSFWLGMQCSGLEAGAAGIPVIAGDETVAERYMNWLGNTPYSFANNKEDLKYQIKKLATDQNYYEQERSRTCRYISEFHDYAAVAYRALNILDGELDWRKRMSINDFQGLSPVNQRRR